MNFIFTLLVITLIFEIIGNAISSINLFKERKNFRLFSYIVILIIATISAVIITDYFKLNQDAGLLAGCLSFWFYFGTRVKNDILKLEKTYKIKKVLGIVLMVVGSITLVFFAVNVINSNTLLELLFVHFYIGISQLAFGYALSKKHPFKLYSQIDKIPSAKADLLYSIIGVFFIFISLGTILGLIKQNHEVKTTVILGGFVFGLLFIGASIQNSRIRKRNKSKNTSLNADELIDKYKS